MATYYVSNAVSNGYVLGSDSNSGLSKSLPFLTWAHAYSVATGSGDSVTGNPSGTTYVETAIISPSGNAMTMQADQTVGGQCVINSTGLSTQFNSAGSGAMAINNITWDGNGITGGGNGIKPHANPITFTGCVWQNYGAGIYTINTSSANWQITAIKCTWAATVADGIVVSGGSTSGLSVQGCTINNSDKFLNPNDTSHTTAYITITKASDGTRTTVSNSTLLFAAIPSGQTITALTIDHTDLNCARGWYNDPTLGGTGTTTYGSVAINNCTATGTAWTTQVLHFNNASCPSWSIHDNNFTCNGGIWIASELASGGSVYNNTITLNAGATNDGIVVQSGANWSVHDNTITQLSTVAIHGIMFGNDGPNIDSTNTTATTTQAIGSLATNQYASVGFTTSALTKSNRSSYLQGITITLSAQGTGGAGTLSFKVFATSGGSPTGSAIETSPTTVVCNTVPGTATTYFIELTNHAAYTANTVYALQAYNSANNATNYVLLAVNATTSGGIVSTSVDGSTWVTTSTAGIYTVWTGFYAMSGCSIYGNTVNAPYVNGTADNHCIITGCTPYVSIYKNQVYNGEGGPGIGFKDCHGGYAYANLIVTNPSSASNVSGLGGFWNKGSANVYIDQNVYAYSGPGSFSASAMSYVQDPTIGTVSPKCSNSSFSNNIVWYSPFTSGGYVFNPAWVGSGVTQNGNTIYFTANAVPSSSYATWLLWQGAGYDTTSTNADPLLPGETSAFTTVSSFIPPTTSPAKGAGVNANGVIAAVADFNSVLFGLTPDSGAFNILATAAANDVPLNGYNPLTPGFNWKGAPSSVLAQYMLLPQVGVFSGNATASPTATVQTLLMDATSGALTATLQSAVVGTQVTVTKTDSSGNAVTVSTVSAQTITSVAGSVATTYSLATQGKYVTLTSNGVGWTVTGNN